MLSEIERPRSTRNSLLYNEQKVTQGTAVLLDVRNYWQEMSELSFEDKLRRITDLTVLNQRSQAKTMHISVNFHPRDDLPDWRIKEITHLYMHRIGYGRQPYLIYRHHDAGHPHCHVVSTNIRPDGSRIENDHTSPEKLREIYAEIDQRYQLISVADKTHLALDKQGLYACRLQYGKIPTKTGISLVLNSVFDKYTYTSFDHWNALLSLYHVRADRGNERGAMYQSRGLYYRMIDEKGRKIGAPIKASSFEQRPTLDRLEQRFKETQAITEAEKFRLTAARLKVTAAIDWKLHLRETSTLEMILDDLRQKRISTVISIPKPGKGAPCFFFIDFERMIVHRDDDLGEQYTPAAILRRSGLDQTLLNLVNEGRLQLSRSQDLRLLQDPGGDPDRKVALMLGLTEQHEEWNDKIVQTQEQQQRQTQGHRYRHSHGF